MSSRDQMPTVRICIVCKGKNLLAEEMDNGQYHYRLCPWCTDGVMTQTQLRARLEYEHVKNIDTKKYDINDS